MTKCSHGRILERTDNTCDCINQIPHLEKRAAPIHDQGILPRLLIFCNDDLEFVIFHLLFAVENLERLRRALLRLILPILFKLLYCLFIFLVLGRQNAEHLVISVIIGSLYILKELPHLPSFLYIINVDNALIWLSQFDPWLIISALELLF